MYNNNNYYQNSFEQYPYAQPVYGCPYIQNNYGYYQPDFNNFYRSDYDDAFPFEDSDMNFEMEERAMNVTKEQIENITAEVKKESNNLLKDIAKFIKDTRLLDYMLACLINYIVRNYERYENVIDEKTDELVEELRGELPWLFDILKVVGITPAMVDDFIDGIIKLTVMTIRRFTPAGL